ncbi:chain length determinant protein EpsF [Noviherbaspirillum sedimenti]|uniref:Chain length determinant protein EpsF n=1 Tax=Noviherbaspirillum sedimenti TaxID=2320865 RepID=A0A3A3FY13_9BURK|nr:chain length determinant protein EpsF [Noviherbaspirillum sedimenti]RJG01083.1 chain length determinant protein EpsF [Noviherbaspirillum sedimenti]
MNFYQFLQILRGRRKIILLTLIVTVLTAFTVSLLQSKVYKSTTSLVLNYRGVDPVNGASLPAQLLPGYMATQVDIIASKNVALKVVDELKLDQGAEVREQFQDAMQGRGSIRDWLAGLLLKNLEVLPSRESSVIDITFKGADPRFAASVANAFASAYQKTGVQLKAEPLKKVSGFFNDQAKLLRQNLEEAQNRLSKYQQEKGIVNADTRLDVETNRLNDLSSQLVLAQAQMLEATSRRSGALGSAGNSPDVVSNSLIQTLKAELARAEARFSQSTQNLGRNHPQYLASQAEVGKLRSELNAQTAAISQSVANNARILQQREAELRTAFDQQKTKVLELNRARDEITMLAREVENAQRAYDTTTQRFTQTSIEGQANQTDVAVLNVAVPPTSPAGPKVLLNTLLAALLGTALGVAIGVLAEMADRRVRTVNDLVDVLDAPVLGVIDWSRRGHDRFSTPRLGMQRPALAN